MTEPRPLRILFVVHHVLDRNAGVGGATLSLGDAMRAQGHEVHYFAYQDAFPDGEPTGHRFLFPWRVASFLTREGHRFDIVDATSGDAWVWLARRSGGPRVVTRAHGLEHVAYGSMMAHVALGEESVSWRYRLFTGGYRLWEVGNSVRNADGVVMLNRCDAAFAQRRWHVAADRLLVIGNAVADRLRDLPAPTRESSDAHPLRLAFVGSWIPRKGIALIAEVADTLVEHGFPFQLDLLGTGVGEREVRAAFSARTQSSLRVLPSYGQEQLGPLLQGAQLLLHPSWAEGFSVALVEGMACGLAPLATDSGAAREVLRDGSAGVFIDPPSAARYVESIVSLDADRARLHALRTAAHATATAPSWGSIASTTIDFYRSLGRR